MTWDWANEVIWSIYLCFFFGSLKTSFCYIYIYQPLFITTHLTPFSHYLIFFLKKRKVIISVKRKGRNLGCFHGCPHMKTCARNMEFPCHGLKEKAKPIFCTLKNLFQRKQWWKYVSSFMENQKSGCFLRGRFCINLLDSATVAICWCL